MFVIVCEYCKTTNHIKFLESIKDNKCESCRRPLKFRRRLRRTSKF